MLFADAAELSRRIFAEHGKIVAAFDFDASPEALAARRAAGTAVAEEIGLSPEKSVFANVAAPLAAAGTPWETARERIARELNFWFPPRGTENALAAAETEAPVGREITRTALARALAAKPEGAPLVVSGRLPRLAELFGALRERAARERFAVVATELAYPDFLYADELAFFPSGNSALAALCPPREAEAAPESPDVAERFRVLRIGARRRVCPSANVERGIVVAAGAGEFVADVADRQIHGRLCGNAPDDVPAGTEIDVFLPPEIFRLDAFPPEENFFELAAGGEILFDGSLHYREFSTKGAPARLLRVAAQFRQSLEIPAGGTLFAWFFPEDALGFPRLRP